MADAVADCVCRRTTQAVPSGRRFAGTALGVVAVAALVAGWFPLPCSIVTVFLFAGPHNWIEARYFLSRLPGRWGKLRPFFLIGAAGVLGLTAGFAALTWLAANGALEGGGQTTGYAVWNSLLILWITVLIVLRGRQAPRRPWRWTLPVGLALLASAWMAPAAWVVALVYIHPLIGLAILDGEIGRNRPAWQAAYRACLVCCCLLTGLLCWRLVDAPSLPTDNGLTARIALHAGAGLLPALSSRLLVALHAFLEMVHYAVWLLAIPLVSFCSPPWKLDRLPLARRSACWRAALIYLLVWGAVLVVLLWVCFVVDYATTRDLYFTVAMLHVLGEIPLLLRAL